MPRRARLELLAAGLAGLAVLLAGAGGPIGLLYVGPALMLAVLLLGGLYPGAGALTRRLTRVRRARDGRAAPRPRRHRQRPRFVPRGGRLIGCGLAGRAPPPMSHPHPVNRCEGHAT